MMKTKARVLFPIAVLCLAMGCQTYMKVTVERIEVKGGVYPLPEGSVRAAVNLAMTAAEAAATEVDDMPSSVLPGKDLQPATLSQRGKDLVGTQQITRQDAERYTEDVARGISAIRDRLTEPEVIRELGKGEIETTRSVVAEARDHEVDIRELLKTIEHLNQFVGKTMGEPRRDMPTGMESPDKLLSRAQAIEKGLYGNGDIRKLRTDLGSWEGEVRRLESNDTATKMAGLNRAKQSSARLNAQLQHVDQAQAILTAGFLPTCVYTMTPSDPNYRDVLNAKPLHNPISYVYAGALGDSSIMFVQESPTHVRVRHVDMDAQQLMQVVARISDKALAAWIKYMTVP